MYNVSLTSLFLCIVNLQIHTLFSHLCKMLKKPTYIHVFGSHLTDITNMLLGLLIVFTFLLADSECLVGMTTYSSTK
jgi:hypothetical protein